MMAYSPGGHGCRSGGRLVKGEGVSRFGDPSDAGHERPGYFPALAAPLPDNSAIVGVWTSKIDSPPTIVLNIEEENGKLIG